MKLRNLRRGLYLTKIRRSLVVVLACVLLISIFNLLAAVPSYGTWDALSFGAFSDLSGGGCPVERKRTADHLASHNYLPNGLVEVNPEGEHPIFELIREAEKEWEKKLGRASKTLEEAIAEYKRRYHRPPPKGFDDWWNYAVKHNVLLPDEYDFIWRDLEPFWGLSPHDLLAIQDVQETIADSYVVGKNESGMLDLLRTTFSEPDSWRERALLRGFDEIVDLLKPVEEHLPQFRITISPHDNPNILSDYGVRKALLDAAKEGRHVPLANLPSVSNLGFASACSPGSPGRLSETRFDPTNRPSLNKPKSFIHEHRLSMDPCTNPSIFYNHAQYVKPDSGVNPPPVAAAFFTYCSTPVFSDIQLPTFIAWQEDILPRENDPPWEEKTDERLLWRGTNTGMHHDKESQERWWYAQRIQLMRIVSALNGTERVLTTREKGMMVGNGTELPKAILNPAMMDIAFTGGAVGCSPDSFCRYMETLFEWRQSHDANGRNTGNHKYFIDVDGNGWSSRFKRLVTSNSLVFKATAYPEWWIDRVQPWVHYVPIQVDYSDLYDTYTFFRGGLYGEGGHDDLARKIGLAGREWSKTYWRKEDMTAYFFRLLLEYARLMSLDRESMSYEG
ncbi:glycosyl transferase family 90-domain-containing protein [Cyathus striatus]|nr:glycosyl transferase family 90-domain-containing protein [Cyathus striatus]